MRKYVVKRKSSIWSPESLRGGRLKTSILEGRGTINVERRGSADPHGSFQSAANAILKQRKTRGGKPSSNVHIPVTISPRSGPITHGPVVRRMLVSHARRECFQKKLVRLGADERPHEMHGVLHLLGNAREMLSCSDAIFN